MSGCSYKMNINIINEGHSPPNPLQKQGFSIITPDFDSNNSNYFIRRTLSADMSSPKWLQNNGFPQSSVKRVQSSEHLQALGEEHNHKEQGNNKKGGSGAAAFEDIWSSILSQQKIDGSGSKSGQLPPPYVHPSVRRSASSLSEKSLEICTESLGSETGSDGFSNPASEPGDSDKDGEEEEEQQYHHEEMKAYVEAAKFEHHHPGPYNNKRSSSPVMGPTRAHPQSFPPPLPSLAHRGGSNLQMRTHRQEGRLVVEAVSVPSRNWFRAQRQDGRLLLTLTNDDFLQHSKDQDDAEEDEEEEEEEEINGGEEDQEDVIDEEEDDDEEEVGGNGEEELGRITGKNVINVGRSSTTVTMSKLIELTSTGNKPKWPYNVNTTVIKTFDEDQEEETKAERDTLVARPPVTPRPKMSTATTAIANAATLNAYEYYWRRSNSPTAAAVAVLKPLAGQQIAAAPQVVKDTNRNNLNKWLLGGHSGKAVAQQEVMLVTGLGEKGEYLVPLLRGCKEPKRPLLFWEPHCITTS